MAYELNKEATQLLLLTGLVTGVGSHIAAITVAQTNAASITSAVATPAPRGIWVWSPDGTGGSVANTGDIAIGYTGLTLANGAVWLRPGDSAFVPCTDAAQVFAVSSALGQTLRVMLC